MAKYVVGDKVRIKKDIKHWYDNHIFLDKWAEDVPDDVREVGLNKDMVEMVNMICTIDSVYNGYCGENGDGYHLEEDDDNYIWSDSMIEPYEETEQEINKKWRLVQRITNHCNKQLVCGNCVLEDKSKFCDYGTADEAVKFMTIEEMEDAVEKIADAGQDSEAEVKKEEKEAPEQHYSAVAALNWIRFWYGSYNNDVPYGEKSLPSLLNILNTADEIDDFCKKIEEWKKEKEEKNKKWVEIKRMLDEMGMNKEDMIKYLQEEF